MSQNLQGSRYVYVAPNGNQKVITFSHSHNRDGQATASGDWHNSHISGGFYDNSVKPQPLRAVSGNSYQTNTETVYRTNAENVYRTNADHVYHTGATRNSYNTNTENVYRTNASNVYNTNENQNRKTAFTSYRKEEEETEIEKDKKGGCDPKTLCMILAGLLLLAGLIGLLFLLLGNKGGGGQANPEEYSNYTITTETQTFKKLDAEDGSQQAATNLRSAPPSQIDLGTTTIRGNSDGADSTKLESGSNSNPLIVDTPSVDPISVAPVPARFVSSKPKQTFASVEPIQVAPIPARSTSPKQPQTSVSIIPISVPPVPVLFDKTQNTAQISNTNPEKEITAPVQEVPVSFEENQKTQVSDTNPEKESSAPIQPVPVILKNQNTAQISNTNPEKESSAPVQINQNITPLQNGDKKTVTTEVISQVLRPEDRVPVETSEENIIPVQNGDKKIVTTEVVSEVLQPKPEFVAPIETNEENITPVSTEAISDVLRPSEDAVAALTTVDKENDEPLFRDEMFDLFENEATQ